MRATQYVADGDVQLSDSQRNAFYGLQKQAIDGDCNVPAPPSGNKTARNKYDAWNAYRGLPKDEAMKKYITALQKIDNSFDPNPESVVSRPVASSKNATTTPEAVGDRETSSRVIIEGTLYKQRDIFKGWSPRHFVLDDCFLHYYTNKDDDLPRKSMQIFGCTVKSVHSAKVGDMEYFPFVISHPKSTKTYNLSADSKAAADKWITALKNASANDAPPPVVSSGVERLLERRPIVDDDELVDAAYAPVNEELTRKNIPEKYSYKIEKAVEAVVDLSSTDAEGWTPLFEKSGVTAFKRGGGMVCIRSDSLIPQALIDIFSLLTNESRRKEIDPTLSSCKILKYFSDNTTLEYQRYKQVWPSAVRDFCNLTHWRLLKDGRVVFVSFSEKFEDLCPLEENVVRAEQILAGFVLRVSPKGTICQYILQCDLRGNLPVSIINLVSSMQPMLLANIRTVLEADSSSKSRPMLMARPNKPVTFQDLLFAFENTKSTKSALSTATDVGEDSAVSDSQKTEPTASDKVRHAVKSAVDRATDPAQRRKKLHKLNTVSLMVLLLPVALYYAVHTNYRAIAFIAGLLYSLEYVFRLHLGIPHRKIASQSIGAIPNGRMLVRFTVDMGRLLRYLEGRREGSGVEITVVHIALKAAAVALSEIPDLNGHVIGGDFYYSNSAGVDVSMSLEMSDNDTVMMKVEHADSKPVDYIADEIKKRTIDLQEGKDVSVQRKARLLGMFPPVVAGVIRKFLNIVGGKWGISIPLLGIVGFPHGACTVVTIPSKDSSDNDVDIAMLPNMSDTATPITITIGGVKLQPMLDQERKLAATHVLNVAVAIDTNAGSLAEGKKFANRVQQLMNTPALLDKADRIAAVSREDEKAAAEREAAHAALFRSTK